MSCLVSLTWYCPHASGFAEQVDIGTVGIGVDGRLGLPWNDVQMGKDIVAKDSLAKHESLEVGSGAREGPGHVFQVLVSQVGSQSGYQSRMSGYQGIRVSGCRRIR